MDGTGIVLMLAGIALLIMISLGARAMIGSDFSTASRRLHEEIKTRRVTPRKRQQQLNLFLSLLGGGALIMAAISTLSIRWLIDYSSQEYWQIDKDIEVLLLFAVLGCLATTVALGYQALVTIAKKHALKSLPLIDPNP